MKTIAFDASTEARTVARHDSDHPCDDDEIFAIEARSHGPRLLPDARTLLAAAGWHWCDVDVLVFGRGPGAFTGLRIAAGLVQGLAGGLDRPVIGIETPRAIAARCLGRASKATMAQIVQDARLGEVYTARYGRDATRGVVGLEDVSLRSPDEVRVEAPVNVCAGGNGWKLVAAHCSAILPEFLEAWPHALDMAHLAALDYAATPSIARPARESLPLYVRDQVVKRRP